MDYKKGLVCYISTCTYLTVALGLYKGVLIYYLYLFGCFINEKPNSIQAQEHSADTPLKVFPN